MLGLDEKVESIYISGPHLEEGKQSWLLALCDLAGPYCLFCDAATTTVAALAGNTISLWQVGHSKIRGDICIRNINTVLSRCDDVGVGVERGTSAHNLWSGYRGGSENQVA